MVAAAAAAGLSDAMAFLASAEGAATIKNLKDASGAVREVSSTAQGIANGIGGGGGDAGGARSGGGKIGALARTGGSLMGGVAGATIGTAVGGPIGGVVGGTIGMALGKTVGKIAEMPEKLEKWGDALLDSQRHLMRYNATIAESMMTAQRNQILRDMGSGQRTGGSTKLLQNGLDSLKDETQELKDVATNIYNAMGGTITQVAAWGIKMFKAMSTIVGVALFTQELLSRQKEGDEDERIGAFTQMMKQMAEGQQERRDFNPPAE